MARPGDTPFLDLDEAGLAGRLILAVALRLQAQGVLACRPPPDAQ